MHVKKLVNPTQTTGTSSNQFLSVPSEIWIQPEKQVDEKDYLYEDDLYHYWAVTMMSNSSVTRTLAKGSEGPCVLIWAGFV
jgi:hypothetical protein